MIAPNTNDSGITFECQICFEEYNNDDKKPMVLDCGHTICNSCLMSILSTNQVRLRKCPFDNKELKRNANEYPVNWSYIDVITSKRD